MELDQWVFDNKDVNSDVQYDVSVYSRYKENQSENEK